MLARVVSSGTIRPGDAIRQLASRLPAWPEDWRARVALVLDAVPRMAPSALNVGADVPGIISTDLAVERRVVDHLREVIALCEQERDYVSRDVLVPML